MPHTGTLGKGYLISYIVLCILLTAGLFTRLTALLLCLLHQVLFMANPAFSYGFDFVAASAIFYCVCFPVGHYRSVDALLFGKRGCLWATPCLRVLQLHLCFIYFFGGLDKLIGPTWHNGEALWKALHLPDLSGALRPDITVLGRHPQVIAALGWFVVILELAYPLCIWLRRIRPLWLCGIVGMHAGIALFMGLYHFSAIMVLLNVVAFHLPYRKAPLPFEQIATQYHHQLTAQRPRRTNPLARGLRAVAKPPSRAR